MSDYKIILTKSSDTKLKKAPRQARKLFGKLAPRVEEEYVYDISRDLFVDEIVNTAVSSNIRASTPQELRFTVGRKTEVGKWLETYIEIEKLSKYSFSRIFRLSDKYEVPKLDIEIVKSETDETDEIDETKKISKTKKFKNCVISSCRPTYTGTQPELLLDPNFEMPDLDITLKFGEEEVLVNEQTTTLRISNTNNEMSHEIKLTQYIDEQSIPVVNELKINSSRSDDNQPFKLTTKGGVKLGGWDEGKNLYKRSSEPKEITFKVTKDSPEDLELQRYSDLTKKVEPSDIRLEILIYNAAVGETFLLDNCCLISNELILSVDANSRSNERGTSTPDAREWVFSGEIQKLTKITDVEKLKDISGFSSPKAVFVAKDENNVLCIGEHYQENSQGFIIGEPKSEDVDLLCNKIVDSVRDESFWTSTELHLSLAKYIKKVNDYSLSDLQRIDNFNNLDEQVSMLVYQYFAVDLCKDLIKNVSI